MPKSIPKTELDARLTQLRKRLDERAPDWQAAIVTRKLSLYYLTGTLPDGLLWLPRDGGATLFVRRGYHRAVEESAFADIRPMRSFRDVVESLGTWPKTVAAEKDGLTLSYMELLNKYFQFDRIDDLSPHLWAVRAVKSEFEMERIEHAGAIHAEVLEQVVPALLREGMTEAELAAEILAAFLSRGSLGHIRVNQFESDILLGYVCFGESALRSNAFKRSRRRDGYPRVAPSDGQPESSTGEGRPCFRRRGVQFRRLSHG